MSKQYISQDVSGDGGERGGTERGALSAKRGSAGSEVSFDINKQAIWWEWRAE